MRKIVATVVSLSFLTAMLAACSPSMTPMSAWSPREVGESTRAPRIR